MESNYEESINSSEQVDQDEDLGVGRSYECVFCKRGFNTAQALGGHMNIHRKDRVKNKRVGTKQPEIYTGPRFYQQQQLLSPSSDHHQSTYFSGSNSSSTLPLLYGNNCLRFQQPPDQSDWRMSLNLGFVHENLEMNRQVMNQKEELDLELRLGYDS